MTIFQRMTVNFDHMILIFENDLDIVKMNLPNIQVKRQLCSSKFIVHTHTRPIALRGPLK